MDSLFAISELLVSGFSKVFSANRELLHYLSFNEAVVNNTSTRVSFGSQTAQLVFSLSIHPAEVPWSLKTRILLNGREQEPLENWKKGSTTETPVYEVYPKLLADTQSALPQLIDRVMNDLVAYFTAHR